jgi:hypothetical protein
MDEQLWCYARDGQRLGPFPFADLQNLVASGGLGPADLVWPDGKPEAAAPAVSIPELFPPAPPAARTGHQDDSPGESPGRPGTLSRVWDDLVAILQFVAGLVVLIVLGLVLLFVVNNLFCGKRSQAPTVAMPASKPLPVEARFRASAVGRGMVLRVKNVSDTSLTDLWVTVTATGGEKAGQVTRGIPKPLEPGKEVEIGWAELDGWQLGPGEKIQIWLPNSVYDPLVVIVPVKAAGR